MKIKTTKLISAGFMTAMLLAASISPAAFATVPTSETGVKLAMYAAAAYDCVQNRVSLTDTTAVNNAIASIFQNPQYAQTWVGPWIGDASGMITCKQAIEKLFSGGKITAGMLDSGKFLDGVYEKVTSSLQKIKCNYGIVNSSANALQDGTYSWPQGYVYDGNDPPKDYRTHGVIEVVFDDDGPIRLEGATSDIDEAHTLESMKSWTIDWSNPPYICQNLVKYTEVYPMAGEDLAGNPVTFYSEIMATSDGTPFDEWPFDLYDGSNEYDAWVHSNSDRFTHTLSPASSTTQLKLKSDAKTKLLANISKIWLNNKTSFAAFLDSGAEAKYIYYGRHLFNGDGNGAFACAGTTVAKDDPNFSDLSVTDYWDTTQPYVAVVKAYKNGTASSKSEFRTKFGGNGIASPGAAKSIDSLGISGDCKALASTFNSINVSTNSAKTAVKNYMGVSAISALPETTEPDPGAGGTTEEESPCSKAGQALGWIICPVVQLVTSATKGIYGYIESSYLQTNPKFISDAGTKGAWNSFRGYANIVFAIVLVIIIFSQLTGFGVSNYGIKKMLPTIIMMAVLVNISFFLCEVAVDISNIVGSGAGKLFDGIQAGSAEGSVTLGGMVWGLGMTFLTGAGTIGGLVLAYNTIEFWIIPFLLMLLVAFVSVVTFFIILGVRQAGIIILVTLAPVAVICYALPNTKKFFERWWKMFLGLLMVYPICGLLMSGGQFASKLLLNVGTSASEADDHGLKFSYAFVAILIQAVPFFFIPSILKSSMAAMGNLGAKISSFSNGLSKSGAGAIKKSNAYKDTQERMRGANAERMLGREAWNQNHRVLGFVGRRLDARNARIRSGDGPRAERARAAYNRRQARYVKAASDYRKANQSAEFLATGGVAAAERRLNNDMMKNFEETYKSDLPFMNNFDAQRDAYYAAIDDVTNDPSQSNIARMRALQNVIGSTPDGQDVIQQVIGRKLFEEQEAARSSGRAPVLSEGMRTASQTLMNDHGGFKSGNRGLAATLKDMNNRDGSSAFAHQFTSTALTHPNGTPVLDHNGDPVHRYDNAHYGAEAAKGSANELANANDATLDNLARSIGSMTTPNDRKALENAYRNASEAITNDTIHVKPENVEKLNAIRQAAYAQLQSISAASTDYYDNLGRQFEDTGNGMDYTYEDAGGTVHNYTVNSSGDFVESGGAGEVISASNMMTATQNFNSDFGSNYRDLNTSDEFKVSHDTTPVRTKITMPTGWRRAANGTWIDTTGGSFRNLNAEEIRRAEAYEAHNIQVDIDHQTRPHP